MRHARSLLALAAVPLLALTGCSAITGRQQTDPKTTAATSTLDETVIHDISIDVDESALTEMIQTNKDSGDKTWIEADVTIDGQAFEQAGIKLDKFVDGQKYEGFDDFTVRASGTKT